LKPCTSKSYPALCTVLVRGFLPCCSRLPRAAVGHWPFLAPRLCHASDQQESLPGRPFTRPQVAAARSPSSTRSPDPFGQRITRRKKPSSQQLASHHLSHHCIPHQLTRIREPRDRAIHPGGAGKNEIETSICIAIGRSFAFAQQSTPPKAAPPPSRRWLAQTFHP
jgi:hypothetical protein